MTTLHTHEHDLSASVIEELSLDDLEELLNMSSPAPKEPVAEPVKTVEEEIDMAELIDDDVLDLDGFGTDIDQELMSLDTIEVSDDDLLAVVNDIETKEAKAAAYEEQPAEVATEAAPSMSERLEKALAAKKEMTAPAARAPKEPKEKKEPRKTKFTTDRVSLIEDRYGAEFYVLEEGDTEEKRDEAVEIIKNMNVKIGEQCVNLYGALGGKATLSVFTKIGLRYLIEKGSIDRSGLHAHYLDGTANGSLSYGVGTANPQTAMCLGLLSALKVIKPMAGGFTLNPKSALLSKLKEII